MKRIRAALGIDAADQGGFTIIEVIVAMMVFAVISVGIAYSITNTLVETRDSRARTVAANLAAQQIDTARSFQNVFKVDSRVFSQVVDGTTYTITRTVAWASSNGSAAACGTSGGLLQAKTVNVSVSWSGARTATSTVQANTMLAPSVPLNDPNMGTILVHVINAAGAGVAGIPISATPDPLTPGNTAQTPNPAPGVTDADGCSYILKAVPGAYVVKIGSTGDNYIGTGQAATPSKVYQVKANDSIAAEFTYDKATAVTVNYVGTAGTLNGAMFPAGLDLTLSSVNAVDDVTTTVASAQARSNLSAFPYPSGYSFYAGNAAAPNGQNPQCPSVDPGKWTTPNGAGKVGTPQPVVDTPAGGTASVNVPMGSVVVKGLKGYYLKAVSATPAAASGDPGCAAPGMTYTYATTIPSNSATVALPFGTWQLYYGSRDTNITSSISLSSLILPPGSVPSGGSTFTVDPRSAS